MARKMARRRTAELRRPDAEPAAVEAGGGVEAAGADGGTVASGLRILEGGALLL